MKNWVLLEFPCRLCKTYMQQVGFLQGSIINNIYTYKFTSKCHSQTTLFLKKLRDLPDLPEESIICTTDVADLHPAFLIKSV